MNETTRPHKQIDTEVLQNMANISKFGITFNRMKESLNPPPPPLDEAEKQDIFNRKNPENNITLELPLINPDKNIIFTEDCIIQAMSACNARGAPGPSGMTLANIKPLGIEKDITNLLNELIREPEKVK